MRRRGPAGSDGIVLSKAGPTVTQIRRETPRPPTLGRYRDSAFGPAFAIAVGLVVLAFLYFPAGWLQERWLRTPPGTSRREASESDLPWEIRVVEAVRETPATPARTLPEPAVDRLTEAPARPAEAETEPVAPASGSETGLGRTWIYDPTTPYVVGRESLLRRRTPAPPPDLRTHLTALQARHSAAWLLRPVLADTFAVASVRRTFRQQDLDTKRRLAPEWMEELRRRRMQEYWERYILSDGDP